ncbi:helix-turn-helix domain-containing protein [Viridibacillus sp. YIM B01967]|uniref:Helix-turn-helix domain-containing protein n=1 Tax=Viridibacillus soli TaxID=2798301 RepID=A0ABS1H8V6_9BACL|nr:helix-turn-helix domain-containing protein [Viridibacillus soli]MBK3495849.1 helix-turn-helix domain-containing protein [Viridibacillus soli]
MDREQIISISTDKLKLVRTENGYTQDKMAEVLGISKKTLVQIEKQRMQCGWTTAVALCALFRESSILQNAMGGDPMEVVELTAHDVIARPKEKTMGGHVWWRTVQEDKGYRLQKNILSNHYRVLDDEAYRWFSTMDREAATEEFARIILEN